MTDIELEPLKLKAGGLWPSFFAVITQLRNEIAAKDGVILGKDELVVRGDAQIAALKSEHADALAEADARTAAATAEWSRLAKLLAEASAAFDAGDVAKLTSMRAAALQTESEKKLAAALAKKAEAEAEIAELT
jgi:hypothetical protein